MGCYVKFFDQIFRNSAHLVLALLQPTSGFMAIFRFKIFLLKNHKYDRFSRFIDQNDQQDLNIISDEKIWGQF